MWALDLGTTNTVLSRWDADSEQAKVVELPTICRVPQGQDKLEAPRVVPSATWILEQRGVWDRLGASPFFLRRMFLGQQARIGREALESDAERDEANLVLGFKSALGREPLRPLTRLGGDAWSARAVAQLFLRELFRQVKLTTGQRIRELVVTTPVDAYESYRAEVSQLLKRLGVDKPRFLDEPVAAALGYGLRLKRRVLLVVDFGGGTLDLALVGLTTSGVRDGECKVLAKTGRPIGGNTIDSWILQEACAQTGHPLEEEKGVTRFWRQQMLAEACRVKEALYFNDRATLLLVPPEGVRRQLARRRDWSGEVEFTPAQLKALLKKRGLYRSLRECLDEIVRQAATHGLSEGDVEDVLMVGGSTLLPDVYPLFQERFGRDRVRAWQPFEAVSYGACAFAAGRFSQSDFIVHDYAFLTYDLNTHEPVHTVIVPRGTRVPTRPDLWRRQLVPTCSLGAPERMFKLVIAEIGSDTGERHFTWDATGRLQKLGGAEGGGSNDKIIVPLNESNPTLGYLDPPHSASDRRPRLEVCFGVNADRWLCATVVDLRSKKKLMEDEPVVRLV